MFGAGQAFEYLLSKLYSNELSEAKAIAEAMHGELNHLIPSFIKRAQFNDYLAQTSASAKIFAADGGKRVADESKRAGHIDGLRCRCRRKSDRGDSLPARAPSTAAATPRS